MAMNIEDGRRLEDVPDDLVEIYATMASYEYNYSMSDLFHPSSYERGFFTSANIGIFLCLCGVAFNLILITLIVGSRLLRNRFIYTQILNVAIADLGFVVSVDCFTVYYDMHKWTFGVHFCKAWMILDAALPSVSIVVILFLNADRILFMYKTRLYEIIMKRLGSRLFVLLFPWCISIALICSLWLGFSEVEPQPGICLYGITKEANTASTWLTVFLPAIFIIILVVFVFIAAFGDMPSHVSNAFHGTNQSAIRREQFMLVQNSSERSGVAVISNTSDDLSNPGQHRRVVVAILAVDFISLFLTLPFTAFSHVSPTCKDRAGCESLRTLFQSLSWMRSSVACFRPLLFILLTEARFVCVREENFCCCSRSSREVIELNDISSTPNDGIHTRKKDSSSPRCHVQNPDEATTTTIVTPPNSIRRCIPSSSSCHSIHSSECIRKCSETSI